MRWKGREQSRNIQDRRGMSPVPLAVGGGGILSLLLLLALLFLGADPKELLDSVGPPGNGPLAGQQQAAGVDDEAKEFIGVVLRDTENVWQQLFAEQVRGVAYEPPTLVIFSGTDRSACGLANAATGPFYCPADRMIYIDPSFFNQLSRRYDAPGDFAQAYVIAHEVSHHVQQLLGFEDVANRMLRSGGSTAENEASVRLELQADYLAGVWAHHAQKEFQILERGDLAEAINAANQIGDDTLQKLSQGYVVPERFTHGTSAQRVRWFKAGFNSGNLKASEQLFKLPYDEL